MESGTEREAFAYGLLSGTPSDPKVRMAGEEVMAGEPTGAELGSIPTSPLTVRYGGTTLPLTDFPTGAVEDTSDIDRQGYEIRGGSEGSYPLEVVSSPPSDRLSAVDSQVSVAPSTAIVAVPKRSRLDDSRIVASDSPTGLPLADAAPQLHQPGLHADQLALPLADTEPREIPWEGLMPPPQVQAEDTRSRTSRGSGRSRTSRGSVTSAASSARYLALQAELEAEREAFRLREAELSRQLALARSSPPPYEPDAEDSHPATSQVSPPASDRASRSSALTDTLEQIIDGHQAEEEHHLSFQDRVRLAEQRAQELEARRLSMASTSGRP